MTEDEKFVYVEYGSSMPIRFLDASQVTMYDSSDKEVMCSCGNPAGSAIIGKEAFVALCSKCMFGSNHD